MKLFVAGATGVIGRLLLPKLVEAGHEVVGMTRQEQQRAALEQMGVQPVIADALDRDAVHAAVVQARPDAIIHQLTSLGKWDLDDNARIRIEGTRHLVDAAKTAGVTRMIAQSICWAYEPGEGPASEDVPLDWQALPPRQRTIEGVAALEHAVAELSDHVILRYGMLYGPDTWYDRNGLMARRARERKLPATDGITSFVHVEDAAVAALLALEWPSGAVNVTDDEPAAGSAWLPVYAQALGAPAPDMKPGRQPWERGASNAKARSIYGWVPRYPTWRTGFVQNLTSFT